jgi:hypothetical protein
MDANRRAAAEPSVTTALVPIGAGPRVVVKA